MKHDMKKRWDKVIISAHNNKELGEELAKIPGKVLNLEITVPITSTKQQWYEVSYEENI